MGTSKQGTRVLMFPAECFPPPFRGGGNIAASRPTREEIEKMGTGTTTDSVGQWRSCLECEHVRDEQDDIVMHGDHWDRVKRMDGTAVAALLPHAKHRGQWVRVERSYRVCEFDGMPLLPVENNCPHTKAIERKMAQGSEQPQSWWEQ